MKNSHDEIKKLIKASKKMITNQFIQEDEFRIKKIYNIITEGQEEDELEVGDISKKINVAKSVENKIENEDSPKKEKKQVYRISGGIIVLYGKKSSDLQITIDEKVAFQETMDEFVDEVAELVDFNKLNVYQNNVEWSGKIIDLDLEFFYSIGENQGIYIQGDMLKTDDKFIETINKLKSYFEKFKSKWSKVLSQRKKTEESEK